MIPSPIDTPLDLFGGAAAELGVTLWDLPVMKLEADFHYRVLGSQATVRDKTLGIVTAAFDPDKTIKFKVATFHVLVNNRKLVFPVSDDVASDINDCVFCGSERFTFKHHGKFIKITERDQNGKSILYVDPERPINKIAYKAYSYIPQELNFDEAKRKIEGFYTEFPRIKVLAAVYNRHGVALFGFDLDAKKYIFYWANPQDEKVAQIECSSCFVTREDGTYVVKSADLRVGLSGNFNKGFILNEEWAHAI